MQPFPPTPAEVNMAIARRVYGYRWYLVSKAAAGYVSGYIYMFVAPVEAQEGWTPVSEPPAIVRGGVMIHPEDGLGVAMYLSDSMPKPLASAEASWQMLRYLAGEHRMRIALTAEEPTDAATGRYVVAFVPKASGLAPVVKVEDTSFERAACSAAMALADWAETKASREAGAKPPAGKDVP